MTNTNRFATIVTLFPGEDIAAQRAAHPRAEISRQRGTPFGMRREWLHTPQRVLCNPPPWGTLAAVEVNTGAVRWEVPLGAMPELAQHAMAPRWGALNLGGSMVTAGGLVFIGAARDDFLRAFDIENGSELWRAKLPAGGQATPLTYRLRRDGRQYVVIAAGGHRGLGTTPGDLSGGVFPTVTRTYEVAPRNPH